MLELASAIAVAAVAGLGLRVWPGMAGRPAGTWVLIAVSAAVVAWWQPLGLAVTLALAVVTWLAVQAGRRSGRRRLAVAAGVSVLVAALVTARWAAATGSPAPLGLSFTVFRLIGVILDGVSLAAPVSVPGLLLLALFFPSYRAGPITTLSTLQPLATEHPRSWAWARIALGLVRKLLVGDTLGSLARSWLARDPSGLAPLQCLVLPPLLGLWIYADFAGYSDIAVGTGALVGYRVPENFDRPYLSRNLLEFWRRWHITLSEWIRTRLFMKMAGRRPSRARVYGAIVVSMALCGLWHGLGVNFLLWGLWHGLGMVAVHATVEAGRRWGGGRRVSGPGAAAVASLVTFVYVQLSWLVFFMPLGQAWAVARRGALALAQPIGLAITAAVLLGYLGVWGLSQTAWRGTALWPRIPAPVRGLVYALLTLAAIVQAASARSFIYFAF